MSKPDSFFEVFEEEKGEVKIKEIGEIKSGEEDEENEAETERENETSEGNSGPSKLKFETLKFLKKQQEVHDWIEKVLNKRITSKDLIKELKDGVLLCQLMLEIAGRTIPKYFQTPQNDQEKQHNIFMFLIAVEEELQISKSQLFMERDLLENRNPVKVINALYNLAEKIYQRGFPIGLEKVAEKDVSQENLESTQTMIRSHMLRKTASNGAIGLTPEQINQSQREKAAMKIQRQYRMHSAILKLKKRKRQHLLRTAATKELLQTEEIYIHNLDILIKGFKQPFFEKSQDGKILSQEQAKKLFSDIEIIRNINQKLLNEIRPRIETWSPYQLLGDLFLKNTAILKIYTNYVQRYDEALSVLSELKKNPKFVEFFKKCKQDCLEAEHFGELEMLLILPIQRIPRYNLLLKEIIKHTWSDHQDYENLVQAQTAIHDIAEHLNEKKKEFESIAKVREIQNSFKEKTDLAAPHRKFIRTDVVALWTGSNDTDKKPTELVFNLFNDLLVVSQKSSKSGTLKLKDMYKLEEISLRDPKIRRWAKKASGNLILPISPSKLETATSGAPVTVVQLSGSSSPNSNSPTNSPQRTRTSSKESFSSALRSRRNSEKRDSFSGSGHYSLRNTLEIDKGGEVILKVCMESALVCAFFREDFNKAKAEVESKKKAFTEHLSERGKIRAESLKDSLDSTLSNSLEERKAQFKAILAKRNSATS